MAEFNKAGAAPQSNLPNIPGVSRPNYPGNTGAGMLIEGLAKTLGNAVQGLDQANINKIEMQVEKGYENLLNDMYVPEVADGVQNKIDGTGVPSDINQGAQRVGTVKKAYEAGRVSQEYYLTELEQQRRALLVRYPGYATEIGAAFKSVAGYHPSQLVDLMVKNAEGGADKSAQLMKEADNKALELGIYHMDEYQNQGLEGRRALISSTNQQKIIDERERQSVTDAKARGELNQIKAKSSFRRVAGAFSNMLLENLQTTNGKDFQDFFNQVQNGTFTGQSLGEFAQGLTALEQQIRRGLDQLGKQAWEEGGLDSYWTYLDKTEYNDAIDEAVSMISGLRQSVVADKPLIEVPAAAVKWTLANSQQELLDAFPQMAAAQAITETLGEVAAPFLAKLLPELFQDVISYKAVVDQMGPLAGKSPTYPPNKPPPPLQPDDSVNKTLEAIPEESGADLGKYLDTTLKTWDKGLDALMNPSVSVDQITQYVGYMFHPDNQKIFNKLSSEDQLSFFSRLSSPKVTTRLQAIRDQKGGSAAYDKYKQFTLNQFQGLFGQQAKKLETEFNIDYGGAFVSFNQNSNRFELISADSYRASEIDKMPYLKEQGFLPPGVPVPMQPYLDAKKSIEDLNGILAVLAPIVEDDGVKTATVLDEAIQAMGFSSFTREGPDTSLMQAVEDALRNSQPSEEGGGSYLEGESGFTPRSEGTPGGLGDEGDQAEPLDFTKFEEEMAAINASINGKGLTEQDVLDNLQNKAPEEMPEDWFGSSTEGGPVPSRGVKIDAGRAIGYSFVLEELATTEKRAARMLANAATLEAAMDGALQFERPGIPHRKRRMDEARKLLAGNAPPEETAAYNFFRASGMSELAAAAMVGSMSVESFNPKTGVRLDPKASGDDGTAIGVAQWRGSRRRQYGEYAGKYMSVSAKSSPAPEKQTMPSSLASYDEDQVNAYLLKGAKHKPDLNITGLDIEYRTRAAALFASAPPEFRDKFFISSGYRPSHSDIEGGGHSSGLTPQDVIFNRAVRKYGSVQAARQWAAPPDHSQHNKGFAGDVGWDGGGYSTMPAGARKWLHETAPQFGLWFPLDNEGWHMEKIESRKRSPTKGEPWTGKLPEIFQLPEAADSVPGEAVDDGGTATTEDVQAVMGDGSELRNRDPGFMEKIETKLTELFGDDRAGRQKAEQLLSATGLLPGIGDVQGGIEAGDAFKEGSWAKGTAMAALAAVGVVPGLGDAVQQGGKAVIKAWHGAAKDFNKFDRRFLRSGEGSMFYGPGFYMGQERKVGEAYKRINQRKNLNVNVHLGSNEYKFNEEWTNDVAQVIAQTEAPLEPAFGPVEEFDNVTKAWLDKYGIDSSQFGKKYEEAVENGDDLAIIQAEADLRLAKFIQRDIRDAVQDALKHTSYLIAKNASKGDTRFSTPKEIRESLEDNVRFWMASKNQGLQDKYSNAIWRNMVEDAANAVKNIDNITPTKAEAILLELEIDEDITKFMLHDRNLLNQPAEVKALFDDEEFNNAALSLGKKGAKKLSKILNNQEEIGFGTIDVVRELINKRGVPYEQQEMAMMDWFLEKGVPGIKFLDQDSRETYGGKVADIYDEYRRARHALDTTFTGDNEQKFTAVKALLNETNRKVEAAYSDPKLTSNFVIFNEESIRIVARYGWAGFIALAAAGEIGSPSEDGGGVNGERQDS